MNESWMLLFSEFMINYWVHSSLFIGVTLLAVKAKLFSADVTGEWLLKSALLAGVVTSLLLTVDFYPVQKESRLLNYEFVIKSVQIAAKGGETAAQREVEKNKSGKALKTTNTAIARESVVENKLQNNAIKINAAPISKMTESGKPQTSMTKKQSSLNQPSLNQSGLNQIDNSLNSLIEIESFPLWLFYFWLFSALILIGIKAHQVYRLRLLLNDRTPLKDKLITQLFKQLIEIAGYDQSIKISQSQNISCPIALATSEIVLPVNFSQNFQPEHIKAALAHELAHLKRKDNFWLAIYQIKQCLFFFQPLNKLLIKELYQLAEQRSDELATRWTGNPRALAEALSVSAEINLQSSQSQLVLAMKSSKGNLLTRVENLMQKSNVKTKRISVIIGAILSLFIVLAAPGFSIGSVMLVGSVQAKTSGPSDSNHVHIESNSVTDISTSKDHNGEKMTVEAKLRGDITFNQDETAILDFPKKSELDITLGNDGEKRIRIERGDGDIEYTYYQNGDKQPYDNNARSWFASVIPDVLRAAGINAEERVTRIRKNNGDGAVLDEVELIRSDYVKGVYMHHLFEQAKLSDNNISRAIALTTTINSDFEQAKVLKVLVKSQSLTKGKHWSSALKATREISSDFEQANVLKVFSDLLPQHSNIQKDFFEAAADISSDFEMRRVFSHVLQNHNTDTAAMIAMFKAAKAISSDFELSSLLVEANDRLGDSSELFDAYLALADSISSDFEMRRAFSALLNNKLERENFVKVLKTASREIGSDFELASLLIELIEKHALDSELEKAIKDAADTIGSNFERSRVLSKLNKKMG